MIFINKTSTEEKGKILKMNTNRISLAVPFFNIFKIKLS